MKKEMSFTMFKVSFCRRAVRWAGLAVLVTLTVMVTTNHTAAAPAYQVNTFPYIQNFDSFSTCSTIPGAACTLSNEWANATNDDIDWTVDRDGTPTANTGPSVDHTTGTSSGKYLYTEASLGMSNKRAYLISPRINLSSGISSPWLSFWYHMYGDTMGMLHVDISTNNGTTWTNDVIPPLTDNQNLWQQVHFNLTPYVGESQLRIRFRGVTGSSYTSDMALDDFMIYQPAPGVKVETILESDLILNEGGKAFNYEIGLWTVPAGAVEVTVTADSNSEVSVDGNTFASSQTVVFTGTTPQTVVFRAVDDTAIEGPHTTTISHAVTATADSASYPLTTTIDALTINISDNDFDSDGDGIADNYDSDPLDPFLPGSYPSVTYQTTVDNEDNLLTGSSDGDLGSCIFNTSPNHPIEFNIFVDEALPQTSAYLSLFVEDVDWPGEVNEVFLNGHSLGNITGENELNYSTLFIIPDVSWVQWGKNLVQVDVDQLNVGNWCANVRNGQIVTDYQGAEADASIRSISSNTAVYNYNDPVTINLEVDSSLTSQTTRLELILRDPNGKIIDFDTNAAARNWVISSNNNEPYQWQFSLPASGTAGLWAVTLTVYDEATQLFQDTATVTFAVPNAAVLQPTVTSITPNHGNEAQVTAVTITGSNFGANTTCTVGGMSLTSANVANNTTITGSVPATLAPGSYDVVCSNSYGSGTLSSGFTVNDVEIPAVIDLNGADAGSGFATLFTQAASPIAITDSDLSINDADSAVLDNARVTLTNRPNGTAESLAADVTGTNITAVYNNTTGILTLTGPDTVANFEQVLRSVTYANNASPIHQTNRVIAFVVNDSAVNSNTANSVITIGTPIAADDSFTVSEDGSLNEDVLANDVDGNGETLTAVLDTPTTNGDLNLLSDGTFSYTPDVNFCGSDSFTYLTTDGIDNSNSATVSLTVTCENDAPTAVSDSYDLLEDAQLAILAPGVLENDSDVEEDALTAVLDTQPASGTLTLDSSGGFTYTPAADVTGVVTFVYRAHDGVDGSETAVVTINIQPDSDSDGIANDADTDDDNDGQSDADETSCGSDPLDENSLSADNDGDDSPDCVDSDDDNDGTPDTEDAFPFDENEDSDNDGDGTGDNADNDDDNDGQSDSDETTCGSDPLDNNSLSADNDADNSPDCVDADDDNDGTPDTEDAFPFDNSEDSDNDGDGIGDNADSDDDNDGTPDDDDAFPFDENEDSDHDGDGTGDNADTDDDNDGTPDIDDVFPFDPAENSDNDGDGQGDNADSDDDNDGQSDADETTCGSDSLDETSLSADNDGDDSPDCVDNDDDNDGTPDDDDALPFDPAEDSDTDGDGLGDNADMDDDNDGQNDADEASCGSNPLDENSLSADNDGDDSPDCVDSDDDNDGTPDVEDAFPFDPAEVSDNDSDGQGDNADTDDDNDGTPDAEDAFPFDPTETSDSDGDGQGDNADTDDDNDGQSDADESSCGSDPFDANSLSADYDGDNSPDCVDVDDDNDGTPDVDDDFPFDDSEDTDTDGDGIGNNADDDDDADGQLDADELACGSNPVDEGDLALDSDSDHLPDCVDEDDDNDGTLDDEDAFPVDSSEQSDSDGDGIGDNADPDDDNDGLTDEAECPDAVCPDSDGDGIPDYLDEDDDGDGLLTVDECNGLPCADSDNDNVPDYLEPNDRDTDDDNIFDHLDADDDGDGIPTAAECPDGIPCPDADGDTIPDYLDHNAAPQARMDKANLAEDSFVLIDVLANDSDPNGDVLALEGITQPEHGTAVLQGTSILYTPDENYFGPDTFTYMVNDGVLQSVGTVRVTVTPVNDKPVGKNDVAKTKGNKPVTIPVLDNDEDVVEGSALTITAVATPAHGHTTTNGTTITYTPAQGFKGTETFAYTLSDGTDEVQATVTVTVEKAEFFIFLPMVIK